MKRILLLIGFVGAAVGWLSLLWPAARASMNGNIIQIFKELIQPENKIYNDQIFTGWAIILIFLLVIILCLVALLRAIQISANTVLSNAMIFPISTEVKLHFSGPHNRKCTITRISTFVARRKGFEAYRWEHILHCEGASIDPKSFAINSTLRGQPVTSQVITNFQTRYAEGIEVLNEILPVPPLSRILTPSIVRLLADSILSGFVVRRVCEVDNYDEYSNDRRLTQIRAKFQPTGPLYFELSFLEESSPPQESFRCFKLRDNVVTNLPLSNERAHGRRIFCLRSSLDLGEMIRIEW